MFWKKKRTTFIVGDVLKFKNGTTHGRIKGLPLDNWYGRVIAVVDGGVKLELDSITLNEIPNELIDILKKEGKYPHIQSIEHQHLELIKPRDTQEDVLHAQDDLIERIDSSKGIARYLIEYNKWSRHFLASDKWGALDETAKSCAKFTIENFYDCMKKYEKKVPSNWTAISVKNVMTKWMPTRIWGTDELFEAYGNVIVSFLEFLNEKGYRNTAKLIPVVLESKREMIVESQKSSNWTENKKSRMEALKAGVDMSDANALYPFLIKRKFGKLHESIERATETAGRISDRFRQPNHPPIAPFIKADSEDPFINFKRNQKITVQYPDGTLKENVKFKEVKDDLYAGLCELIKK